MNEQQYRLAKTILFAIALVIAAIWVWSNRFYCDTGKSYVIDKWTQKILILQE